MPVIQSKAHANTDNQVGPKDYSAPRLTEYGHVERLTQGGASAGADGGVMKAAGV